MTKTASGTVRTLRRSGSALLAPPAPALAPPLAMPPFEPHPLLAHGHLQTLAAYLARTAPPVPRAGLHRITLPDGDQLVLHEDAPPTAAPGRAALLVHGLGGCHASPYMLRVAAKLRAAGIQTLRLDLRGCGAGIGLARYPNHAGRSDDLAAAIEWITDRWPGLRLTLVGFSLAGNMALKLAGEVGGQPPGRLDSLISICAPIDLEACVRRLRYGLNRLYDRHITQVLVRRLEQNRRRNPQLVLPPRLTRPLTLEHFDALYTAPVCGFADQHEYYRRCAAGPLVGRIAIPALVLAARDDPLIAFEPYRRLPWPACVRLWTTAGGGHLGHIARRGRDPDRWWLDWRIVEWITHLA